MTISEALLADILRAVVDKQPQKLGAKRSVSMQLVLEAASIDEVHLRATDALLNELSYKSPSEFAEAMDGLLSIKLMECPASHKCIEIKASRDIFIHNEGLANDRYARKAASHGRVQSGMNLPVDIQYFLESYEACLQPTAWLQKEMHNRWHSSEYEDTRHPQLQLPSQVPLTPPPQTLSGPPQMRALKEPLLAPPPSDQEIGQDDQFLHDQ